MFYMKNRCGAWQVGSDPLQGKVEFRIFFPAGFDPGIASIRVAGDFQQSLGGANWDFPNGLSLVPRAVPGEGTFWEATTPATLPAGFYQYKYLIGFTDGTASRKVSDPCTRYSGLDSQNAAVVVGGSQPAQNVVHPLLSGRKPLADLNVYELMIDDFTAGYRGARAPLDAVVDKLDELRDLGFNAILFMPWTAWKHAEFDWGYEPYQYFAVESRYTMDLREPAEKLSRLKRLISECHDRGIHVIMDGVFNHVSVDFPYKQMYRDPAQCPFTGEYGGSFPGLLDLDFDNTCTNEFIRDVCLYWMEVFGLDGIRFDNTVNFYVPGDPNGLPGLLASLQQWLDGRGEQNFSFTLEHLETSAAKLTDSTTATSFWDSSLYQLTFDALWNGGVDQRLANALNNRRWLQGAGKVPTLYLGNHDHSHVTWQCGARSNEGAARWFKTQPFAIALFTATATPLVQNGQEFGEEQYIPENDHNTGRRVSPRPLRWKCHNDSIGQALLQLYGRLGRLRRDYPGLRSANMYPDNWEQWQTRFKPSGVGIDTERQVMIYHRWGDDGHGTMQTFVVVLNFSDTDQTVSVPFPKDGAWTDLLSGDGTGCWSPTVQDGRLVCTVGSNWGHVFFRSG